MPRSAPTESPGLPTAAELRRRAQRLRQIAREFPRDTAEKLLELAAELDARAAAMDLPITPDAPDA
jgi:hypothetical protein